MQELLDLSHGVVDHHLELLLLQGEDLGLPADVFLVDGGLFLTAGGGD